PISDKDYNSTTAYSAVPVTGLSLSDTSITLDKGTTKTLTATVAPANATNPKVTFRSNDTNVATVDSAGTVTAVSDGVAVITAKTQDGSFRQTCTVTVSSITGLTAAKKKVTTYVGNKYQLVTYSSTTGNEIPVSSLSYKSKNKKIASVNSNGIIKAKKVGKTKIVISYGSISINVTVVVKKAVKVTSIKLKSKLTMTVGTTKKLKATLKPKKATNKTVKWKSSNTKVATVDENGYVTAVGKGKATITCIAKDGSKKKAKCKVKVK
nr:Ig-like domain-containing protein [Butyrivibrio sp.]